MQLTQNPTGSAAPRCPAKFPPQVAVAASPPRSWLVRCRRPPGCQRVPGEDAERGWWPPGAPVPPPGAAGKLRPPGRARLPHSDPGPPASASQSPPGSLCAGSAARQQPREGAGKEAGRREGTERGAEGGGGGRERGAGSRPRSRGRGIPRPAPPSRPPGSRPRASGAPRSARPPPEVGPGRTRAAPRAPPRRPPASAAWFPRSAVRQPPGVARPVSCFPWRFKCAAGPGPLASLPRGPHGSREVPTLRCPVAALRTPFNSLGSTRAPTCAFPWRSKCTVALAPLMPLWARDCRRLAEPAP